MANFFKNKKGGSSAPTKLPSNAPMGSNAPKMQKVGALTLSKIEERKEKVVLSLRKHGIEGIQAEVKLVLDASGSMNHLYRSGAVQKTLEKLIPIAMKFDDNQSMEVYTFHNNASVHGDLNLGNLEGYVKRELRDAVGGCTYYAEPIKLMMKEARLSPPTFVIFITDGENHDQEETRRIIREASKKNVYFQFVGIGNENFRFLKELDDISGRRFDNAGFISTKDINSMDEGKLYDKLLEEFAVAWNNGDLK